MTIGLDMIRHICMAVATVAALGAPSDARSQAKTYALEGTGGLTLHNVTATAVTHEGKRGVRVMGLPIAQPVEALAVIDGTDFTSGVIEAEMAGAPAAGAPEGARGFVGIAFRVQPDMKTYDAFYLRPTNGRANDQVRRNHSVQYISHPDWPWMRLRQESPKKYESYVDLVPGAWTAGTVAHFRNLRVTPSR